MPKRLAKTPAAKDAELSLTEAEWDVIRVVWDHEPCAAGTVQETLKESHGWAYSTVKTMMDRMVSKGLLATHSIRNLNLFTSCVTRADARRGELRQLLRRAFDGAISPMIQFLVEDQKLSESDLEGLRRLIRKSSARK